MRNNSYGLLAAIIAIVALALIGQRVAAEPPIGSHIDRAPDVGPSRSGNDAVRAMHTFARCASKYRHSSALKWLTDLDPKGQDISRKRLYNHMECEFLFGVGGQGLHIDDSLYRGAIAEAILKDEGYLDRRVLDAPPAVPQRTYARGWFSITGRNPVVDETSVCVSEVYAEGVYNLLRTEQPSLEERAAVVGLSEVLGKCLVQGAVLKADIPALRAALAEAYFHRFYVAKPASLMAPGGDRE